jgi:hypothetical protein
LKRLALFWLVCAAVGFAVAASVAVVLSFTVDGGLRRAAAAQTTTRALELRPAPASDAVSSQPRDAGHGRLTPW